MTHYLRFADEAEARVVLAQYLNEDGNWITGSHDHALDVVGTIYKPTGEMGQSEFGPYPLFEPIPGFHVNYIGSEDFSAYEVFPSTPSRVFA